MTDPRTSTALRHLDLPDPPGSPWEWAIVGVASSGRIRLPDAARAALGAVDGTTTVMVLAHGEVLVVRPAPAVGRRRTLDARGRLYVPHWLRTHPMLLVGSRAADGLAMLAPPELLDPLGNRLLGGEP